jgi:hypothetical protein
MVKRRLRVRRRALCRALATRMSPGCALLPAVAEGRGPRRYVDYLLEALKRRELFQWLTLAPAGFLHTLLFRDRFNFLGVAARLPARLLDALSLRPGALTQARRPPARAPLARRACLGPMRPPLQRAPLTGTDCGPLRSLAACAWGRSAPACSAYGSRVSSMDRRVRQGEEGPLEVAEADEDALEHPEIEQVWTIKARAGWGSRGEAWAGRLPAGAAGRALAGIMPAL